MRARASGEAADHHFLFAGAQRFHGCHAESIGARPTMEDACCLVGEFAGPNTHFYGLYDCHGGSNCAVYCTRNLHAASVRLIPASASVEKAIIDAIAEANTMYWAKWGRALRLLL